MKVNQRQVKNLKISGFFHRAERGMIPPFYLIPSSLDPLPLPGESGSPANAGHFLGVRVRVSPLVSLHHHSFK